MIMDIATEHHHELAWIPEDEGQLSVDVLEDDSRILIRSAVAGTRAEDLDISVTSDTVTIRGKRGHGCEGWDTATSHVQECYWGHFSRSVVLPSHVRPEAAEASLKHGILTVSIPKTEMSAHPDVLEMN